MPVTPFNPQDNPIWIEVRRALAWLLPSVLGVATKLAYESRLKKVTQLRVITSIIMACFVGYATGAGATVTQITSRTTGVTINNVCGQITLVSAAGSTTWQSFTVTNSRVAATDVIVVNQDSGTDLYMINVTNVSTGSFRISFATTGGTTTEQHVFGFAIIKSVIA